jgi:hypothetical protein
MPELLTFDAANRWLTGRVNVPTGLTSAELALSPDFPAQVRAHAFFSAQVQSAEALEAMREEIDAVAAGTTDYASARARLKDVLSRRGWAPDDVSSAKEPPPGMDEDEWKARKRLTNLASTRRLDLVLRQNVAMAHAVGQREVSMNPVLLERFPYFRYIARSDARTTHGALNNVILRKDDPFWNTHTPPWEFNCRCMIEDADAEDAARYGGVAAATAAENQDGSRSERVVNAETGAAVDVPPSPSGFVFRIDEPFTAFEMSRVQNIPTRRAVMMRLRALARTSGGQIQLHSAQQSGQSRAGRSAGGSGRAADPGRIRGHRRRPGCPCGRGYRRQAERRTARRHRPRCRRGRRQARGRQGGKGCVSLRLPASDRQSSRGGDWRRNGRGAARHTLRRPGGARRRRLQWWRDVSESDQPGDWIPDHHLQARGRVADRQCRQTQ